MKNTTKTIQDRAPNFRDASGKLFLVRCFNCSPELGRENHSMYVSAGTCNWCGWSETPDVCTKSDNTECGDFKQKTTNWYDACEHGNSKLFCNACRYVPSTNPFDSANQEISRLRKENERLEVENKMLRGTCIRSSDDIDSYIEAKRHIDHLERIVKNLLDKK